MQKTLDQNIDWQIVSEQPTRPSTGLVIPGQQELYRSDDGHSISIRKDSYTVFNNDKLVDLTQRMASLTGGSVVGFETFKKGAKTLGFVKPGEAYKNVNGLPMQDYIVIGNSHDGSTGIFIGTSTTLIRCTNAFSSILKDHVIRHSTNYEERLEDVVGQYYAERNKVYEELERMSKVKIDQGLILAMTNRLFDIENREEISIQKRNQINKFEGSLDTEFTDLDQNMWGFFNGVTHYTTHKRGVGSKNHLEKNSFGNVVGSNAEFNKKAVKIITSSMSMV